MLRHVRSLILGFASLAAVLSASAGNTSTDSKAPDGFADLTTNDKSKAFSTRYPDSSSWHNGSDYTFAFDNGKTYDSADRTIINQPEADYGYAFDEPTVVNGYAIYLSKQSHNQEDARAPGRWTFEASNDKESWVTLDSRGIEEREDRWGSDKSKRVVRYYEFSNTTKYLYYRLNVTGIAGDNSYIEFSELEFFNTNLPELDVSVFAYNQEFKVAGMDEGVTLNNLPVLVRFNPSEMSFGRDDRADLAFVQGDVPLVYEVDSWTTESALVWVRLASAARGATFTMFWGADVDVASQFLYKWNGYASVVHFNGVKADNEKYEMRDSTLDAARIGLGVAGSRTFAKTPFASLYDQTRCAVSVWARPNTNANNVRILSTKADFGGKGCELIYVKGTGLFLRGNNSTDQVVYNTSNDEAFPPNAWAHYVAVLDGSLGAIYKNGQRVTVPGTISTAYLSTLSLMMGGYTGENEKMKDSDTMDGVMDELRVYNGVPSDEWVKAEYQAMADENFLTTDAIPSSVELLSIDTDQDISKVTIVGNVQLGDGVASETVVIGVGTTETANDKTYEVADCGSGAFTKVITDLEPGRYYFTIALKSAPGTTSAPRYVRVGVLPPVEWTGAAGDNKWLTPENWSTGILPKEDDSVIFGDAVTKDLSIVGGEGAMAKKMTITTPYALTFGAIAVLQVEVAETANEHNAIGEYVNMVGSLTIDLMDGISVATWTVPEGKTLRISNLKGRASVCKTGLGVVQFGGSSHDRSVGTTEVREGLLTFETANQKTLGTGLIVGGGDKLATVQAQILTNYNPFDSDNRTVSVKANGTLDLTIKAATKPWVGELELAENAALKLSFGRTEDGKDMPLVVNGDVTIAAVGTKLELAPIGAISKSSHETYTVLESVNGEITGDFAQLVLPKPSWELVKETDEQGRVKALKVKCAPMGFAIIIQ